MLSVNLIASRLVQNFLQHLTIQLLMVHYVQDLMLLGKKLMGGLFVLKEFVRLVVFFLYIIYIYGLVSIY